MSDSRLDRRALMTRALAALIAAGAARAAPGGRVPAGGTSSMPLDELTLGDLAAALARGELTSQALTQHYLDRIAATNHTGPALGAVLETNPAALATAATLDRELRARGSRGPLHGVPILLKDNIETADRMMTSAGSLALEGWYAPHDAPLVARLRAAGAVILGKTNLSEWANFRSNHSVSGWSARGGQTRNPYALDRSPSGSSSGSAVAVSANLCALAVGSETDGSIVSPAAVNGIVGLKPTVGLVSRSGIVPISHNQDTAGPLTRSVRDAAVLLGIMAGPDPADAATLGAAGHLDADYTRHLDRDGLRGARLGITRRFFADNAPLDRFLDECIGRLRAAGAVIVDPADWEAAPPSAAEQTVLLYDFKADLNAYLARLPDTFPARSLESLIRFNDAHAGRELALFDQELLRAANATGGLEEAAYREARAACLAATRRDGIDAALGRHHLDALVTLTSGAACLIDPIDGDADSGGCSSPAAVAGYPHITVPAGLHRGLPIGLSFFGTAWSEATLLKLAYGFEQSTRARVPPRFAPSAA